MHCLTMRTLPNQCMLQCFTQCENLRKRTRHHRSKTVHHWLKRPEVEHGSPSCLQSHEGPLEEEAKHSKKEELPMKDAWLQTFGKWPFEGIFILLLKNNSQGNCTGEEKIHQELLSEFVWKACPPTWSRLVSAAFENNIVKSMICFNCSQSVWQYEKLRVGGRNNTKSWKLQLLW